MISPGKGILLIANPFLKDPNFARTVIFLCEHRAEGSLGFVINKSFPKKLHELLPDIEVEDVPTFYGGPVQTNSLQFIHQFGDLIPDGDTVLKNTNWGGNFESMVIHLKNNDLDFEKIRFFIGYSGWSAGQLEEEMKENTWLTVAATEQLLFATRPEDIWKESLRELGGDYEMMINFPLDPQLN